MNAIANKYGFIPNPKPRYVLQRETKPLFKEAFSTFDIEWFPGTYEFRCAAVRRPTFDGAASADCIETYTDLDAFVHGLFNPSYQGTIYAHNAGKGDLLVILRNLLAISKEHRYDLEREFTGVDKFKAGFDFELMVSCNVPIIASVTDRRAKWKIKTARRNAKPRPNQCWRIVDSVRTWPAPLSKIAASMGMAKKNDFTCEGSRSRTDEEEANAHIEYVREHYARELAEYERRIERHHERASRRELRRASQVPATEHLEFYNHLMEAEQRTGKSLEDAYVLAMQERAQRQVADRAARAGAPFVESSEPAIPYNPSPPPMRKKTRTCGHEEGHCVFYAPIARTVEYCAYDAEILYQFIYRLQTELNADNIQLKCTAASIAMNAIKRNCLPAKPIPIDVGCNATSRKAYTGGRVEPIFRGRRIASRERPLYQYDIASAYPYAMTFPLPGELVASGRGMPPLELPFIALCEVSVPLHLKVPPLPLKLEASSDDEKSRDRFARKATDAIVYPVGQWVGWYTSIDIHALIQAGGEVTRWFRHYAFEPFELDGFAQRFYEKKRLAKEAGETFREALYKLLLNSGYGKLCEDPIKDGLTTFAEPETYDTRYTQRDHKLAREIYRKQSIRQSHHEHVPAGAFITSYVRACLWSLADQCLRCEKCNRPDKDGRVTEVEVFYFDTDSLTTTCAHANEFTGLRDGELGSLKLEHEIYDLHIAASKVYAYLDAWNVEKKKPTTKVIAKGFAGVRELADYERIVIGETDRTSGEYTRDRHAWHRKSSLSTLLDTGELRETVISREFRGKGFPKRNYAADGTSVPWHVDAAKKLFHEGWEHLGDEATRMAEAETFADSEYGR